MMEMELLVNELDRHENVELVEMMERWENKEKLDEKIDYYRKEMLKVIEECKGYVPMWDLDKYAPSFERIANSTKRIKESIESIQENTPFLLEFSQKQIKSDEETLENRKGEVVAPKEWNKKWKNLCCPKLKNVFDLADYFITLEKNMCNLLSELEKYNPGKDLEKFYAVDFLDEVIKKFLKLFEKRLDDNALQILIIIFSIKFTNFNSINPCHIFYIRKKLSQIYNELKNLFREKFYSMGANFSDYLNIVNLIDENDMEKAKNFMVANIQTTENLNFPDFNFVYNKWIELVK